MADPPREPDTAPFSARYAMVRDAEVVTWGHDEAVMDYELFRALKQRYGEPVVGYVGGLHYAFKPVTDIRAHTAAIPQSKHGQTTEPAALLIQK